MHTCTRAYIHGATVRFRDYLPNANDLKVEVDVAREKPEVQGPGPDSATPYPGVHYRGQGNQQGTRME